jgi:hypothetical protein
VKARIQGPKDRDVFSQAKELWTSLKVRLLGITAESGDIDAESEVAPKFFDLLRVRDPIDIPLLCSAS